MTVLLIDDDDDALSLLQMMLRRKGIMSHTAHTLGEARDVLAAHDDVDCIVTDLELADGEDGLALWPESHVRVPRFVVLTGRSDVEAPEGCVVLLKPVELNDLLVAFGHQTDG